MSIVYKTRDINQEMRIFSRRVYFLAKAQSSKEF